MCALRVCLRVGVRVSDAIFPVMALETSTLPLDQMCGRPSHRHQRSFQRVNTSVHDLNIGVISCASMTPTAGQNLNIARRIGHRNPSHSENPLKQG